MLIRSLLVSVFLLSAVPCVAAEPQQEEVKNSVGMRLRRIPAGKYHMGSPANEPGRQEREALHEVRITRDFYLGVFEISQREYAAVTGKNPSLCGREERRSDAGEQFDNYPVESVNWHDAQAFCEKLTSLKEEVAAGRSYRLPTEAEWEYACRAGTKTVWSFGNDRLELSKHAWYRQRGSDLVAHPVGEKLPNAWGLYDMHGNVWEWCHDWYQEDVTEDSLTDDPPGPKEGVSKVIRGGSFVSVAAHTRSATRYHDPPKIGDEDVGFRVVMVPIKK